MRILFLLLSLYLPIEAVLSQSVPVKIERAWIQAVPPVSDATAAYMKITNLSSKPLKLTDASSPIATRIEPMITTRKEQAGKEVVGMQSVAELIIPAGN